MPGTLPANITQVNLSEEISEEERKNRWESQVLMRLEILRRQNILRNQVNQDNIESASNTVGVSIVTSNTDTGSSSSSYYTSTASGSSMTTCSTCGELRSRSSTPVSPTAVKPPVPAIILSNFVGTGSLQSISPIEHSPGESSSLEGESLNEDQIEDINRWADETPGTEELRYAELVRRQARLNVPHSLYLAQRRAAAALAKKTINIAQIKKEIMGNKNKSKNN